MTRPHRVSMSLDSGPIESGDGFAALATIATAEASRTERAGESAAAATVEPLLVDVGFERRYEPRTLIGRGGMGEIWSQFDRRIGREVAIKRILGGRAACRESTERFVREARVQGQLEHPAVVPVYDLGLDSSQHAFFSMKRVRGTTLDEILDQRVLDPGARARFTRRRLLSAFVQVCRAVDFAHSRGVIHRDLKPANVMLGEYGEVHVLDWGVAKVVTSDARSEAQPRGGPTTFAGATPTGSGAVLGTPGYMSPEQAMGDANVVDARADVYSLGAILFEILYEEPLHGGASAAERVASTLAGADMRAACRRHGAEVVPELEILLRRACAVDRADRMESAGALADAVERILDGEQDLERRKAISDEHVRRAAGLTEHAIETHPAALAVALRELVRALAVDPDNTEALGSLETLLRSTPNSPPPAARGEIAQAEQDQAREFLRAATVRHGLWTVFVPLALLVMPVRSVTLAIGIAIAVAGLFSLTAFVWRARPGSRLWRRALIVGTAALMGLLSTVFGPFVFVPALAATYALFYAPLTTTWDRRLLHTTLGIALVLPAVLVEVGVGPPLYGFLADGSMVIRSELFRLSPAATVWVLALTNVFVVVVPGMLGGRFLERLRHLEERALVRSWYLRHVLAPSTDGARETATPPGERRTDPRTARDT